MYQNFISFRLLFIFISTLYSWIVVKFHLLEYFNNTVLNKNRTFIVGSRLTCHRTALFMACYGYRKDISRRLCKSYDFETNWINEKKNKNKIFYFIITKSPLLRICKQKRNPFWRNHDYTSHDRFGGPANPSVLLI